MANIYYNSGNVGIGTATVASSAKFEVWGNAFISNGLWFNDGTSSLANATSAGSYSSSAATGDFVLRSAASTKLLLQSGGGASAIAITSTGNVGIGTNNPAGKLHVEGTTRLNGVVGIQGTADANGWLIRNNLLTSGSLTIGNMDQNYGGGTTQTTQNSNVACLSLECSNNTEMMVHNNGYGYHSFMRYVNLGQFTIGRNMGWGASSVFKGNNGTAWDVTSDHRIKENVKKANLVICYDNVKNINLYRFNYTKAFGNDTHKDRTQLGFIAQQVNLYYPKSITRGKRKLDDNKDVPDLASIDITQVNFTLFGAVKQLIRVVEKQSNRIKRLEEMLNIVADDEVDNDADEPYVKIHCEEVDIDSIVPSEPEENISSSNTSNVF